MKRKIINIITKIIFFSTLFSVIGLLGYGLCGAYFGYTVGITLTGFDGFKSYISNVLNDKFSFLYLLLCFLYNVCYIVKGIKCRNNKKDILNSILFISLIPYFMNFSAGLYSSKFRNRTIKTI